MELRADRIAFRQRRLEPAQQRMEAQVVGEIGCIGQRRAPWRIVACMAERLLDQRGAGETGLGQRPQARAVTRGLVGDDGERGPLRRDRLADAREAARPAIERAAADNRDLVAERVQQAGVALADRAIADDQRAGYDTPFKVRLAGVTMRAPAGTSRTTTVPAPIMAPRPMRMPGITLAPAPMNTPSSTVTTPESTAPGAMWAWSPIRQS
jgi:hypothetical protein